VPFQKRSRRLPVKRFDDRTAVAKLNLPFDVDLPKHAGSRPRIQPRENEAYSLAGVVPKVTFSPRNAAETAKVVDAMRHEGAMINIRGAGTKQWRPPAPRGLDAVLDMTRCKGILEHTPADLTATVAAGTPFAELQAALRPHGQFFPCDPVFASTATIGGVLAARCNGALRQRYGSLRDNVLGMRVCLSDGSIAFTGAKVVKSVAGYDIPKLFVGSFGTLGAIAEVTLKVAPLPAHESLSVAWFKNADAACEAALHIASSPLFPLAMTLHDALAARRIRALDPQDDARWALLVRCGGVPAAVGRQLDGVRAACSAAGSTRMESLEADRVPHAWSDVSELACGVMYSPDDYLMLKIIGLPTQTPSVVHEVSLACSGAEISAHPALGIVYAHLPADNAQSALACAESLLEKCASSGWQAEFLSAPPALVQQLFQPVPAQAPLRLMRRVKAGLDPTGTFDPGRLLAGI